MDIIILSHFQEYENFERFLTLQDDTIESFLFELGEEKKKKKLTLLRKIFYLSESHYLGISGSVINSIRQGFQRRKRAGQSFEVFEMKDEKILWLEMYDGNQLTKREIHFDSGKISIQKFKNGQLYREDFKDMNKVLIKFYNNSILVEERIFDGINIYQKIYWENGNVKEEGIIEPLDQNEDEPRTGIWKFYFKNGEFEKEIIYSS